MIEPRASTTKQTHFHAATPILRVRSLEISLDHYVRVLGFHVDWKVSGMASVARGRCSLMLCEGGQGNPGTWVWIGVSDARELFSEFSAKGAIIRLPPTRYPWALEIQIEDPDAHILRFGSDPEEQEACGDRSLAPSAAGN